MTDFLDGKKTYMGIAVALLGFLGVARFFGGTDGMTTFLDLVFQVVGLAFAAYGRYKATE
jgi:hypothetical protein